MEELEKEEEGNLGRKVPRPYVLLHYKKGKDLLMSLWPRQKDGRVPLPPGPMPLKPALLLAVCGLPPRGLSSMYAPLKSDLRNPGDFLQFHGIIHGGVGPSVPHSRQTLNGNIGCPGAKVLLA